MTFQSTLQKLQEELDGMRTRLDELRVRGNLGKMELRDKLTEYRTSLEPAYLKAKAKIADLSKAGAEESKTVAKSLVAGWDELLKTHKELSEEASQAREKAQEAKRKADR